MARLVSSGIELNTVSANVEFDQVNNTPTISTGAKRSGSYGLNPTAGSVQDIQFDVGTADMNGPIYIRIYLLINTSPAALTSILVFNNAAASKFCRIRLATDNTLELWNASAKIGSSSSALSTGVWYRIELGYFNNTSSGFAEIEGKVDGTTFSSTTTDTSTTGGLKYIRVGNVSATSNTDLYVDDIAINDSSGSFQNTWPGSGSILHLRPNANGDNTQWGGGTGGSEYAEVDEVTPDDGTTVRYKHTAGTDDFNIENAPADIGASDTINVVSVGCRFAVDVGGGTQGIIVTRCKATSGGTVEESSNITIASTSYSTNNTNSNPGIYSLTLYDLPGASTTKWTKSDLDTAQIGVRLTNNPTNTPRYTTVWMLVDYTPSSGTRRMLGTLQMMGLGN